MSNEQKSNRTARKEWTARIIAGVLAFLMIGSVLVILLQYLLK